MNNKVKKRKHKWGYFTVEVFPSHREVVITRKSPDREEHLFISIQGFRHLAKQFLKHDEVRPLNNKVEG